MISQEEIKRIKNFKGFARGHTIMNTFQAILKVEGEKGLKKFQSRLKEMDLWVKEYESFPKNIKTFEWYPLWYDILPMVVAVDLFKWDEEKIRQIGFFTQKVSFFEKLFFKYFFSLKSAARTVGERWKKHYSLGKLKTIEVNEKEKRVILVLENFVIHPIYCLLLEGYFQSGLSMVVTTKTKSQETKCPFRGDPYHEFWLTWE